MVPDYGTKYDENTSSHNGGMCEDRQNNPTCSYIPWFHSCKVVNNNVFSSILLLYTEWVLLRSIFLTEFVRNDTCELLVSMNILVPCTLNLTRHAGTILGMHAGGQAWLHTGEHLNTYRNLTRHPCTCWRRRMWVSSVTKSPRYDSRPLPPKTRVFVGLSVFFLTNSSRCSTVNVYPRCDVMILCTQHLGMM